MSWYVFLKLLCKKRLRQNAKNLSIGTYIKLCLDGFLPNKKELYQFAQYDRKQYITDQQMLMTAYIDGEHAVLLNDKILFELVMGSFVHVPKNYAFVDRGRFISLDSKIKELYDIKELIVRDKKLIAKPTNGLGGKGIKLLQYNGEDFFSNGQKKDWHEISKALLLSGDVIICEYIRQSEFANYFYPHTVNTIRMLSMRDPESRKAFIAAAAFRIGSSLSSPVDNLSAGGIACDIDLVSGRLGKAAKGFYRSRSIQWVEKHPDTGARFAGHTIEGWSQICMTITGIADKFPQLPYIAWDVAMGKDDIVVIEGNTWSDVAFFQIYRPLLLDKRIESFLKHHKII